MSKEKNQDIKFSSAPTQNWNDLNPIHQTICMELGKIVIQIKDHLLLLLTNENFKDDPEVLLFQKCFLEDFTSFSNRITEIRNKYEDKKGLIKEDELALYLTVGHEYEVLAGMMSDVLFKTATEIQSKVMQLVAIKEKELNSLETTKEENNKQEVVNGE